MKVGIDTLIRTDWLKNKRVGLVSHMAARDSRGCLSAQRMVSDPRIDLACLFGPEHGFAGKAGAGEACRTTRHHGWGIPVYSLYGKTKKPTASMLRDVDTLVFDIQDIGTRCYTYVSTLRYVLEAAARYDTKVIVADRPIPLPRTLDGPVTRRKFRSFVSLVDAPMSYGMTPGETSLWLRDQLNLDLQLRVAKMTGYHRQADPNLGRAWARPSPSIYTWDTARCFPATVCFEGLPAIDHGRRTRLAFQVIGSKWMNGGDVARFMRDLKLPGVTFRATQLTASGRSKLSGIKLAVTVPHRFRPILTAVSLVHCLQELYGKDRVWKKSRPAFFDKLFGTDQVRKALLDGDDGKTIAAHWQDDLAAFSAQRRKHLLY